MMNLTFVVALMASTGNNGVVPVPTETIRNRLLGQGTISESQFQSLRAKYLSIKEGICLMHPNYNDSQINDLLTKQIFGVYDPIYNDVVLNGGEISPNYAYPGGLSSDEFWYIFWNLGPWDWQGIGDIKDKAIERTMHYYGHNGNGDDSDAFRHTYLSALLTYKHGKDFAIGLTTRHEQYDGTVPLELLRKEMDLNNNLVGANLALDFKNNGNLHDTPDGNNWNDLAEKVANAVKYGHVFNIKKVNSSSNGLVYTSIGCNSPYYPPYC